MEAAVLEVLEERIAIQQEGRGKPDPTQQAYQQAAAHVGLTAMSTVQPESVSWLWAGRIPYGKVTLLDGDPGLGKSFITLAIATSVSLGRGLPGELPRAPGRVLLLSAEDGLADTVRPRLDRGYLKACGVGFQRVRPR
jgi:RecA-family ATPase